MFGPHPTLSPASAYGAGGNGSLLALSTRTTTRQSAVIQRFRLGTLGLLIWPFAAPPTVDEEGTHLGFTASVLAVQRNACSLPGCGAGPLSPWHLVTSCGNDHIRAWRNRARSTARELLARIATIITSAHLKLAMARRASAEVPPHVTEAGTALATAVTKEDWESADGAQLLMRLLCAAPFSAHDVRQPTSMKKNSEREISGGPVPVIEGMPMCHALGTLLDATVLPRHCMRPYANAWLTWSHRHIAELAGAFACTARSPNRFLPCREQPCNATPPAAADEVDTDDLVHCSMPGAVDCSDIESGLDVSGEETQHHPCAGAAHA